MLIHVRRRHIRDGKIKMPSNCPIALAYIELTGDVPCVCEEVIECHDHNYMLPLAAQRFIARFDAGLPVKPFAFVLK